MDDPISRGGDARSYPDRGVRALLGLSFAAVVLCSASAQAATMVTFDVPGVGSFKVDLFTNYRPTTVNNFLSYVNGTTTATTLSNKVIYRDYPGFVIQGGLKQYNDLTNSLTGPPGNLTPINLEYGRANTKGTIAMARTGNPNSATSEWFINLVDNSAGLGPGGFSPEGYAVFGWVLGNGMSVVNQVANLYYDGKAGGAPEGTPLFNYTAANDVQNVPIQGSNYVYYTVSGATPHKDFHNPLNALDVNNDGAISTQDAVIVKSDLLNNGIHPYNGAFSGNFYFDVNDDNGVSTTDVIQISNYLLQHGQTATPAAPAAMALLFVPEPSSWALAAGAAFALGGYAIRRARLKRHSPCRD